MSLPKLQIMTLVNGNARRTVIYNSKHFRYKRGYKRGMVRKMLVRNTYIHLRTRGQFVSVGGFTPGEQAMYA